MLSRRLAPVERDSSQISIKRYGHKGPENVKNFKNLITMSARAPYFAVRRCWNRTGAVRFPKIVARSLLGFLKNRTANRRQLNRTAPVAECY